MYGSLEDVTQGIHQFVPFLCDQWVYFPILDTYLRDKKQAAQY